MHNDIPPINVAEFLGMVVPRRLRHRIAVMFSLAFDESGTHDKGLITVGAYVAEAEEWSRFASDWSNALPLKLLPFHTHGFYHWARSHPEWRDLRDRLWRTIANRAIRGFQVSMPVAEYERVVSPHLRGQYGAAYAACVQGCLRQIEAWADGCGYDEPFAYFFELGHKNLQQAVDQLELYELHPGFKRRFRLGPITKVAKTDWPPLQAADVLVYHVNRFLRSSPREKSTGPCEQMFRRTLPDQLEMCNENDIRLMAEMMHEAEQETQASRRRYHEKHEAAHARDGGRDSGL